MAELTTKPVLWVQADSNQVEVSLIGPDGRKWTSKDYRESGAIVVQLADLNSGSSDEVFLAKMLGANAVAVLRLKMFTDAIEGEDGTGNLASRFGGSAAPLESEERDADINVSSAQGITALFRNQRPSSGYSSSGAK